MGSKKEPIAMLWEVTCHNPTREDHAKFLVIDMGNDPNFQCEGCDAESNHLPPEEKYEKSVKRWGHHITLIGRLYEEDLRSLAKKDQRGWRE